MGITMTQYKIKLQAQQRDSAVRWQAVSFSGAQINHQKDLRLLQSRGPKDADAPRLDQT